MAKRPIGIIIFSLIFLGFVIARTAMYISFLIDQNWFESGSLILGWDQNGFFKKIAYLGPSLFLSVVFIWMTIDVYRYKRWAYYFLILFSVKTVFHTAVVVSREWRWGPMSEIIEILSLAALIIYFIHPRIRHLFIPNFDVREKWSLGVLLLAWFLIIPAVFHLCGSVARGEALLALTALAFGWLYHLVDIFCGVGLLLKSNKIRYFTIGFAGFTVLISLIKYNLTLTTIETTILNGLIILFLTRQKVIEQFRK